MALSFFFLICKVSKYDHTWRPWGTVKCPRSSGIRHLGVEEKASFQAVEPSHLSESSPGPICTFS